MANLLYYSRITLVLLAFALLLNGCATILKGCSENIMINSIPGGAEVYIDGKLSGLTPISLELKTNSDYNIRINKAGHKEYELTLESYIDGSWVALDIICLVVPLAVDAVTGCYYTLETNQIDVLLEKEQ